MKILEDIDFLTEDNANRSNIKLLSKMIESDNVSHAYLFYGNDAELLYRLALDFAASVSCPQKGCGNCVVCRNVVKGVYPNVLIIEPEGNILRIEEIARLQKFMGLSSYIPGKKICIIREAELMNQEAGSRLLKTLEDPPDGDSIFLLLTEDISVVLPTVVSRCLVYNWNFKFDEDARGKADFEVMDKYLDEGIKSILRGGRRGTPAVAIDLTLRVIEILKKMEAAVKTDLEKDFFELKRSDFEKSDINKYMEILKSKHKRKISKFHNLGISRVFDIISAWLEDILAVKLGAGRESLNFSNNFSFIGKYAGDVRIEKIFELIETVEGNRGYLNYSINSELALDNIFLQFQNIYTDKR
ncbi:MAG: DNA polymerase III subunit delta' C-terminal domain-containing protein [Actinomycetota bacterium]|nr:DNA polymerase III subunit delta' C-terminal domain-containing protein [Actinomycetota bacterium]